ncbi:MAG: pyridoxamine 5'-phosphate oxidase family protein [Desulfobacteraceae bacterium]|nr:MAG: pyridoxamine 5'-phosphate oxidase family protein [Desulfobacteraceae bacterium]
MAENTENDKGLKKLYHKTGFFGAVNVLIRIIVQRPDVFYALRYVYMEKLEKMKTLAKAKDFCVMATVSGSEPHCSLMAYVADDHCREIYMATHKNTKKYKNLKKNPSVSILIDTREEHSGARLAEAKALTIGGVLKWIEDKGKREDILGRLLKRHPHLKEFVHHSDAEILCFRITSFLLLDGLTEAHFESV